jgi:phytanoyl-CoA hydroxylase
MQNLTPEQITHYRTEGYLVLERLFDADDLVAADVCISELTEQAVASSDQSQIMELEPESVDGKPTPRRIYNPFKQHEQFRKMATDARILDRVEQLIGPDLFIQHSKLNMKPARVGSVVEWHQDLTYFPHTNDDLITMLIYLDDANVKNGCLQVLPQKHHAYLDHCNEDGSFAGMVTEPIDEEPLSLEAPAGSVILMHCLTPHCSLPNHSDRGRRTLIFEYRAADSFPLYMGPMTGRNEEHAVLVRGEPASFARLGDINPLIPRFAGKVSSLYDLQNRTKSRGDLGTDVALQDR